MSLEFGIGMQIWYKTFDKALSTVRSEYEYLILNSGKLCTVQRLLVQDRHCSEASSIVIEHCRRLQSPLPRVAPPGQRDNKRRQLHLTLELVVGGQSCARNGPHSSCKSSNSALPLYPDIQLCQRPAPSILRRHVPTAWPPCWVADHRCSACFVPFVQLNVSKMI